MSPVLDATQRQVLDALKKEPEDYMTKCKKKYLHLRKNLQKARYRVLEDGENWLVIVQEVEAVGKAVSSSSQPPNGLGDLIEPLQEFVKNHHPSQGKEDFEDLLNEVKRVRNDMAHTGAAARAAAKIATTVGIYLEDTLMAASGAGDNVKAYIQKEVVQVYTWQRLEECRRLMLTHSFSYLPIKIGKEWKLLTDVNLAKYLAQAKSIKKWKKLMWETVECAKEKELELECVKTVEQTDSKVCALKKMNGKAAIVTEGEEENKDLVGIITPFDLL